MSKDPRATGGATGAAASKKLRAIRPPQIHVEVTGTIIDEAIARHSGYCMGSEAVKIAAPWARNVSTDIQTIRLTDPRRGVRYIYLTPRIMQDMLIDFDSGVKPQPFSFKLRNGQVTSSWKRVRTESGVTKMVKERNDLNRRKLAPEKYRNSVGTGTIIGGKAPPKASTLAKRKPSIATGVSYRREFGLRAYVNRFNLDNGDLSQIKVPTGAPSISER